MVNQDVYSYKHWTIQPRQKRKKTAGAPLESLQEQYLRNVAILFLDHIVSDFERRFSAMSVKAVSVEVKGLLLCLDYFAFRTTS